jgi:hypothetical protein
MILLAPFKKKKILLAGCAGTRWELLDVFTNIPFIPVNLKKTKIDCQKLSWRNVKKVVVALPAAIGIHGKYFSPTVTTGSAFPPPMARSAPPHLLPPLHVVVRASCHPHLAG